MKKMIMLVIATICVLGLTACSKTNNDISTPQTDISNNTTVEVNDNDISEPPHTQDDTQFGCLQELVDSYGFPIYFKRLEGMNLITVEISENSAKREWKSNDGIIVHDNLKWSIIDNHLLLDGEWKEDFTLNVETGRAVSTLDETEYEIVIYNKEGNPINFAD